MNKIKLAIAKTWEKIEPYLHVAIKWVHKNWLLSLTLAILLIPTIMYLCGFSNQLVTLCDIFVKVLTPYSIIIGIVLGYPLLKKKLAEKYVTKQFDLRMDSNNLVRKKCLQLIAKYQIKNGSTILDPSYINTALEDVTSLRYDAIDANPEVYKYVDLLFRSIRNMGEAYSYYNETEYPSFIYKETFSSWMNAQLNFVFDCSKYIGYIPTGETNVRQRLNERLSRYVSENIVYSFNGLDTSINHYHSSALLVSFFGINNRVLSEHCDVIFKKCYEAVPTPSPIARLLFNSQIYIPPILLTPTKVLNDYGKLCLIGFKRKIKTTFGSENVYTTSYYTFIYANISDISFVRGTIHTVNDLANFTDGYLNVPFSIEDVNFHKSGGYICLSVDTDKLTANFNAVETELKNKFIKENNNPK